jgi:hypothetical protein
MSKNKQVILIARPTPGPLEPSKLFEVKEVDIPKAETAGQIVMKVHYLSLDPTMRGWLVFLSDREGVGGAIGALEARLRTTRVPRESTMFPGDFTQHSDPFLAPFACNLG